MSLPALVVREEDEAPLIGRSQQDVADGRHRIRIRRRQRDRVGQCDPGGFRLCEPPEELLGRVLEQVRSSKRSMLVRDIDVHPVHAAGPYPTGGGRYGPSSWLTLIDTRRTVAACPSDPPPASSARPGPSSPRSSSSSGC